MAKSGFIKSKSKYNDNFNFSYFDYSSNIEKGIFNKFEDINNSYNDENNDYVEKLYSINDLICDIGNKYYNNSFDSNDFKEYTNILPIYNFNENHTCPIHVENDNKIVNIYCLNCNEILCSECIKKCIKYGHKVFEIDFIKEKHLTQSINLITKLNSFTQILSDYLDNCNYYIEKIKYIKKIKLEELKEYQNFILETTNEEINKIYLIEKEIIQHKNYYEHRKNKIIQLIQKIYNSNIEDPIIHSKVKKYNKLFQKNNIEVKNIISENTMSLEKNFESKTISIKNINQNLNCIKDNKILYISDTLNIFNENGIFNIYFQGNYSLSFKLVVINQNKNINDYQQYCINLIIENKELNKMMHLTLNKEKENEKQNTTIYGILIKKNEFFSLITNNKFNYEFFITKYNLNINKN